MTFTDPQADKWLVTDDEASDIALTRSELRRTKKKTRLINNAFLMRDDKGKYYVVGTDAQVQDTKRRVWAGETGLLFHQRPGEEDAKIGDPLVSMESAENNFHIRSSGWRDPAQSSGSQR